MSKFALQDFQGMSKCAVNKVVNILPCEREVSGPHNPNHLGKFAVLFSVYPSKSNGDLHVIVYGVHSEAVVEKETLGIKDFESLEIAIIFFSNKSKQSSVFHISWRDYV